MARSAGDRFECQSCGAAIVYDKPCTCNGDKEHSEICCGQQMKQVEGG